MSKEVKKRVGIRKVKRACGLCGQTRKLVKTPCCDNWICNDERNYIPFDYFSSCFRNHRRYTLCAFHHTEGHEGKWQECKDCLGEFTGYQFEDFANGSFNFEKLEDFSKIKCVVCGFKSESKEDFAFQLEEDYYCTNEECQKVGKPPPRRSRKRKAEESKVSKTVSKKVKKACGLCGKNRKLTKTECCDNWICDDEHKYRPFSFALNSCHRNHKRYTLCAYHHVEGHEGKWQECENCLGEFTGTDFEDFANGSFNFEKLEDFSKIKCVVCGFKSESKEDFPLQVDDDYYCTKDECQKVGKQPSGENTKRKSESSKVSKACVKKVKEACGLCGETKKLLMTDCCNNWICNGINKCYMSHKKYTLCSYHYVEGHEGKWQECIECKKEFADIDFNDFANGSYNFVKLEDYPQITRTCVVCGLKSEDLGDFAFKLNDKFYCTKDECQSVGKPPSPSGKNTKRKAESSKVRKAVVKKVKKACSLCGETEKLTKTECCDYWVCEPFGINKCLMSHERYSLCGYHCTEGHEGKWQECIECRRECATEWDFNDNANGYYCFEKFDDYPKISRTCVVCGLKSEDLGDFSFKVNDAFYCTKDECKSVGKTLSDEITKRKAESSKVRKAVVKKVKRACSLCGETRKLTKTECCDNWVCEPRSRNKCHMSHRKYTLCGYHCTEGHEGKWQECIECRRECATELDFNDNANGHYCFEKFDDYPKISRTCVVCGLKSEDLGDFAFKVNDVFYCTKAECESVGKTLSDEITKRKAEVSKVKVEVKKACGLCGETLKLTKTKCCDNWVCEPSSKNKCHFCHRKYTLCGYHCTEGHEGKWQECIECKKGFDDFDFNDYANGSYNFVKLKDYPLISRTCVVCGLKSEALGDFAFKVNDAFYCTKDECQSVAKPPSGESTKTKAESSEVSNDEVKVIKVCGLSEETKKLTKTELKAQKITNFFSKKSV